jgi:AcrR family transcriptional regulator
LRRDCHPKHRDPASARPPGDTEARRASEYCARPPTAIAEKTYRAVTLTDTVTAAARSRRSFYNQFSSKAAAFIAAYEHAFEQMLAVCTPAFFSSVPWPERVWRSMLASTSFLARQPGFAYIGFVECHALGGSFAQRVHETQLAFTLFLEEGYRQRDDAQPLSRSTAALTAIAIAEVGFRTTRGSPGLYIRRMQPLAAYIALAPFIGSENAGRFVMGKVSDTTSADASAAG